MPSSPAPFALPRPLLLALTLASGGSAFAAQNTPGTSASPQPPALATAIARQAELEGRVLWMDATANLQRLSTREGVSDVFEKCKKANINTVVVDVKPLSGHVLYNSKIAPKLQEWRGFRYPLDYDLLATALIEGRRRGIKVYAAMNTFSEAHKLIKSGPLYTKPELQAIVYDVQRTVTAPDGATWTLSVGENRGPEKDA
ncbi:MAG TPA: family 10 glycosylhydrolase, partial [Armatimonadota bacterium]|nr:family 10 glycosylhydrolase [Armatimonadota bacterium]